MRFRFRLLPLALGVLSYPLQSALAGPALATAITPNTAQIEYDVSCFAVFSCHGDFRKFIGEVTPLSAGEYQIKMRIAAGSITNVMIAAAPILRGAAYFDVNHYPVISFFAADVRPSLSGDFVVQGVLTLRGIAKNLNFTAHPLPGGQIEAKASLDRRDFGMGGSGLIGQTVNVTLILSEDKPHP